jgi:hypothetical protein
MEGYLELFRVLTEKSFALQIEDAVIQENYQNLAKYTLLELCQEPTNKHLWSLHIYALAKTGEVLQAKLGVSELIWDDKQLAETLWNVSLTRNLLLNYQD